MLELELEGAERVMMKKSNSGNDNAYALLAQAFPSACGNYDTVAVKKQKRAPEYNRVNTKQQNEG